MNIQTHGIMYGFLMIAAALAVQLYVYFEYFRSPANEMIILMVMIFADIAGGIFGGNYIYKLTVKRFMKKHGAVDRAEKAATRLEVIICVLALLLFHLFMSLKLRMIRETARNETSQSENGWD